MDASTFIAGEITGILLLTLLLFLIYLLKKPLKKRNSLENLRWRVEDLSNDHFNLQMTVEKLEKKIKKLKKQK